MTNQNENLVAKAWQTVAKNLRKGDPFLFVDAQGKVRYHVVHQVRQNGLSAVGGCGTLDFGHSYPFTPEGIEAARFEAITNLKTTAASYRKAADKAELEAAQASEKGGLVLYGLPYNLEATHLLV